ncbi:MAG: hypothetical protein HFH48_06620, partial [Lachnospiraceae bacterium]|nr:hypothetical protein [Lachnospiraceae bacterium]
MSEKKKHSRNDAAFTGNDIEYGKREQRRLRRQREREIKWDKLDNTA